MPEFQGGSYNPWGGPQGGCPDDLGPDFANLFYRNLIYQRVSAISLYMLYGGTNWGWHGSTDVGELFPSRIYATGADEPSDKLRLLFSNFGEPKAY